MEWTPSNEVARYDQARVARLKPVFDAVEEMGLSFYGERKVRSILSAIEIQIEEGGDSPQANGFLIEALRACILHQAGRQGIETEAVLRAIDAFSQAEEERWAQMRAGTLPPIVPPEVEQFEDLVEEGYTLLEDEQTAAACDRWLAAWDVIKSLVGTEVRSAEAFDEQYMPLQSVSDWSGDMLDELANAAQEDPIYNEHLLRYAQEYMERFPDEPPGDVIILERERADALWRLDRHEEADSAYVALVARFPDEGWAYIGWSDLYSLGKGEARDFARADEILRQALARPDLHERAAVQMRMKEVYRDWGRPAPLPVLARTKTCDSHSETGPQRPLLVWERQEV